MKKTVQTLLVLSLLVVSTASAQYTKLLDFAGATNGNGPYGSLISDGSSLYGMTIEGGSNNLGTIFKINPDGTGYTKLLDFAGAINGSNPYGSLISDGTFLYGMTTEGGINNLGTIFKINFDGTGYTKLLDFAGAINGRYPYGSLISDGSSLYGMTVSGGTYGFGTIFKINSDGTGYAKLQDFAGGTNGSNPYGSLVYDGTTLYGMTVSGGSNGQGIIFEINPNGTGYAKLMNFAGAINGDSPYGTLISDGTSLYGMTWFGGSNNLGTLFKIIPGVGFSKLLDFAGATNGSNPNSSLIWDGNSLYGMTVSGGSYGQGTIFKINPDGTGYTKLLDFTGASNGNNPYGSLISDGTFLYGMTRYGGSENLGTVFKYCFPPTADAPDNISACGTYVLPALTAGDYYTATNGGGTLLNAGASISSSQTLYVYVQNICGSDENSFDVTIITSIPISTITVSGITLTADENGATYQWLDCDNNNAPITGETNQSFTPTANGSYAVEITKNGCSSTSPCTSITTVGISEYRFNNINIYPNPSKGIFTVVTELVGENYAVTNILGEVLFQSTIIQTQTDMDLSNYPYGVYFLKIEGKTHKLIKQ